MIIDSFIPWFNNSLSHWFIDPWFIDALIHCFIDRWLIGSFSVWFIESLIHWCTDALMHGIIDSLIIDHGWDPNWAPNDPKSTPKWAQMELKWAQMESRWVVIARPGDGSLTGEPNSSEISWKWLQLYTFDRSQPARGGIGPQKEERRVS